jgi:predicted dehydrogenase
MNSARPLSSSAAPGDVQRIGVVGTGKRICDVLTLLLRVAPGVRVSAVYDPDAAAVEQCRSRLAPEAAVCGGSAELCAREDVDWVFIGSWNRFHAEQVIEAFAAGKHVFCEKPLALNLDDAVRMHAAWKASGCIFALGLVLRYSPLYRAAREVIESGKIGRILSFEFNETLVFNHGGYIHGNWRRHTLNAGSHLLEKCCHDLDLALWLVNDLPVRVASFGGRTFFTPENRVHQERIGPDAEGRPAFASWVNPHGVDPFTDDKDIVDHQVAILDFQGGVRATFHTHCMAALPERRFYLIGSEGTLRLDAYTGKMELCRVGWNEPVEITTPADGGDHAGADEPMAIALAECMAGRRPAAAGFTEGMRSLILAQAIDQAMTEGRVVDLAPLWSQVKELS